MDFDDIITGIEHIPILKWIIKLLKKIDFFKDHKRLYHTENKIKAFGNGLKAIDVPFEKILQKKKLEIPCLILLRQKDDKILSSEKLRESGFKMSHRAMGMYVLPPLKVIGHKISDKQSIQKFLEENFGLNAESKINLRFCILVDLNKQYFSFRHSSIKSKETKPVFDLLQEEIIEYLGEKDSIRYIKEYYKKDWKKKESEIIQSTPFQHISYNFLDREEFDKIAESEQEILKYMKDNNYVSDYSFLELSKISEKNLKDTLIHFCGNFENIKEATKKIKEQAEFMANQVI